MSGTDPYTVWRFNQSDQLSQIEWSLIEGKIGDTCYPNSRSQAENCGLRSVTLTVTCRSAEDAEYLVRGIFFGIGQITKAWSVSNPATGHRLILNWDNSTVEVGRLTETDSFTGVKFKSHRQTPHDVYERLSSIVLTEFNVESATSTVSGNVVSFGWECTMYVCHH